MCTLKDVGTRSPHTARDTGLSLGKVVGAEPLDQRGGCSAEPLRLSHQLLPGGLALVQKDALVQRLGVFHRWQLTTIEGRLEASTASWRQRFCAPRDPWRSRHAGRRAPRAPVGSGASPVHPVSLPTHQQYQQPSVCLALDGIH